MNPLLEPLIRNLAHGTPASALPGAPVVPHGPGRSVLLRRQVGAALHGLARRVEPQETSRVETVGYRAA
jgi:hypothetical protein